MAAPRYSAVSSKMAAASTDVPAASISSASAASWSSAAIGRPYRSRIASAPA